MSNRQMTREEAEQGPKIVKYMTIVNGQIVEFTPDENGNLPNLSAIYQLHRDNNS